MSQTGDLQIDEMMNYELSLYILRQLDKPQLAEAIRNYASPKSDNAITQAVPGTDHYVLYGWRGIPTVQFQITMPHSQSNTIPKPL